MTQTSSQQKQTVDFFNKVAKEYSDKYHTKDAFYSYFFWQRILEATHGFNFTGKSVIDIGCGTGQLYDYMNSMFEQVQFTGADISENMLRQSKIPVSSQYVGNLYQLDFQQDLYDFAFMLGVSTYMSDEEWIKNVDKIKHILKPGGHFIVSFTNRNSLDLKLRKVSSTPARWLKSDNKVMGQAFKIHAYNVSEALELLEGFEIKKIKWLNQTVFPFSKIFPRLSVKLAGMIKSRSGTKTLDKFSSDFVIVSRLK